MAKLELKKILVLLGILFLATATIIDPPTEPQDDSGFENDLDGGDGDDEDEDVQDQDFTQGFDDDLNQFLDQSDFDGTDEEDQLKKWKNDDVWNTDVNARGNIFGSYKVSSCKRKKTKNDWNVDIDDFSVFFPDANDIYASYLYNPFDNSWNVRNINWGAQELNKQLRTIIWAFKRANRLFRKGKWLDFQDSQGNSWVRMLRTGRDWRQGRKRPRRHNQRRNNWNQWKFFDDESKISQLYGDVSTGSDISGAN